MRRAQIYLERAGKAKYRVAVREETREAHIADHEHDEAIAAEQARLEALKKRPRTDKFTLERASQIKRARFQ